MNKNLLLIAGAAVAYALLRPKNTTVTPTTAVATGANAYVPVATTTPTTSGNNWLNTAGGIISGGTALVTNGASAWDQIKDALHLGGSTQTPNTTGTTAGNVWAGPSYETGVWAGPKYEDS